MNHILILDDSPDLLESFKMILSMNGYDCDTVLTEKDFRQQIGEKKPDLILLDIHLDGTDGRDLCREVKQDPATAGIPVILTSGNGNKLENYLDYDADGILEKPFSLKALLDKISSFTQHA